MANGIFDSVRRVGERAGSNVATGIIMDRLSGMRERAGRSLDKDENTTPDKRGKPVYPFIDRPTPLLDVFDRVRKR